MSTASPVSKTSAMRTEMAPAAASAFSFFPREEKRVFLAFNYAKSSYFYFRKFLFLKRSIQILINPRKINRRPIGIKKKGSRNIPSSSIL